jgi:uncharacterized protein
MSDKITEQVILKSIHNLRPFLVDIRYNQNKIAKPIIIFVHGFKGFKDWGHFNLMADEFADRGFVFVKFNFSHNGTTISAPFEFDDLDAFSENNFTKELDDIKVVLDYVHSTHNIVSGVEFDLNRLFIIGHSRGGGAAIIKASEDDRIKGIVTWAALNNFKMGVTTDSIEEWKKQGVIYAANLRTNQNMPMKYQLYEDYASDTNRFDPLKAMAKLQVPALILHGDMDETVPVSQASELAAVNNHTDVHIIKGADHVFGGTHPFQGHILHDHATELLNKTITFFKNL